jgi:hypothetical protein
MIKYNLGCGQLLFPGYINVDKYPYEEKNKKVDILCDLMEFSIKEASADELLMVHVIEHFLYDDAITLIKRCHGWLRSGGELIIESPDMIKCFNSFKKNHFALSNHIFGDLNEVRKGKPEYYHKWGWTGEFLSETLKSLGYNITFLGDGVTHARPYRDFCVRASK